jgi:hypothetical protein
MKSLLARVDQLERALGQPGECDGRPLVVLRYLRGQLRPAIPPDAPRCRGCGQVHPRFIERVVVKTRAEVEAVRAENQREAGP